MYKWKQTVDLHKPSKRYNIITLTVYWNAIKNQILNTFLKLSKTAHIWLIACKMQRIYVELQLIYISMRNKYAESNYWCRHGNIFVIISVEMQFIYIDMRDTYVDMQFIYV